MATSAWFDYNVYMANKLAEVQKADTAAGWDMAKLVKAFSDADFGGAVGAEKHFEEYGQYEDVAPNAFFNATEYFRAKAAQFYDKAPKAVTDLEVASMQLAIKDAGLSAWSHYEQFGNEEKVNPSNSFDTEAYMNAKLTALNNVKDGKQWTLAELNDAFKNAGLSALEHFMTYGGAGDGEVTQKIVDGKIPTEFAVPEEKKVNSGGGSEGKTFTLTKEGAILTSESSVDVTPVGHLTTGDDTINALSYASGSSIIDASTTDNDTLNVMVSKSTTSVIKNIENINVEMFNSTADFSLTSVVGAKQVAVSGVTNGKISGFDTVSASAPKLVLNNYANALTLGFADVSGSDTANVSLQGTSLGAALILDDGAAANDTAFELLNISSDGTAANVIDLQVDGTYVTSVTKTVITGKQDLTLVASADDMLTGTAKFQAVDAKGHEGTLTLQIGKNSADATIADTSVNLADVTGLDRLVLHDDSVVDVSGAASGLIVDINSDTGSKTYTISGNASVQSGIADVLDVNLLNAKAATITALDVSGSGFETVNLHNTGAAHTITTLTGGSSALTDSVVITGDKDLTIAKITGIDVLDARDFDGKLNTAGGSGGESVTIFGSDQNDTYTFVAATTGDADGAHDTVTMGKGGDTIDLSDLAGWETYGYATAATAGDLTKFNLFKFEEGDSVAGSKADTFGFDASTVDSFIEVSGATFATGAGANFAIDTWMDGTFAGTPQNGTTNLYGKAAVSGEFGVYVKSATEAYVYQNTNGDNVFGEGDFMVKIAGSALDSGDFKVVDGNLMFTGA